jgi:TonB family protein
MNNYISILIQSSLVIAVMFIVYLVFMKKDTFFRTNRFYLLAALLLAAIFPFVDFSFLQAPGRSVYTIFLDPVIITPEGIQASISGHRDLFRILFALYLLGVTIFAARFFYQLHWLYLLVKKFGIVQQQDLRIVFTSRDHSPFSFFSIIFLNTGETDSPESKKIIAHERVHIRQWHSLDLVLLELITILQWFNPFIWLYRRAFKTLHEYLADEGVLHSGVDVKVYSALLFEQSTGIRVNDLVNNFSKSLLKRRFIMMTKERTSKLARLKLLLVVPLAISLLLAISFNSDVMAQEEEKLAPPPPPKEKADIDKPLPPQKEEKLAKAPQDQEVPIFTVVEEMPEYPGGMKAMYAYLGENIKYPQEAKNKGISGTVFITYVVEKDGSVSNVKVLRGVKEDLDKEAIRVVSMMPKWKPGKQKGIPVRVQYNLPIKFSLEETQTKEK